MTLHFEDAERLLTPCREWQGARTPYGTRTRNGKAEAVHRWVWEQINGPIPPGMCVLHHCDNPPCYRYDHLWLGTRGDNARDMASKGRARSHNTAKTHCPAGHPYDEANTISSVTRAGHAKRECRICRKAWSRRYWQRKQGK